MSDPIHPAVAALFGSRRARPRLVRGYTVQTGWVDVDKGRLLTVTMVARLQHAGYSMIEVRWRRRTRGISLLRIR